MSLFCWAAARTESAESFADWAATSLDWASASVALALSRFGLCPAHGIRGVAHGLLGGTDSLRGGAYGIGLGFIEGVLGVLGRLEGGLVRLVLLGCIRLGVCETRLRLLEVLAGGIGGVLALRDLTGVLVHCRSVGCRAGADCRIVGCLGLVAGGSRLVVGPAALS